MEHYNTYLHENGREIYSDSWQHSNQLIRVSRWADTAETPFSSTLWPRYGSEVKRSRSAAQVRFINPPETTLELLLDGVMHYTQNGIYDRVSPGEVYLIHKGSDTLFELHEDESFHRLRLMLRGSMIVPLTDSLRLTGQRVIAVRSPETFAEKMRRVIRLMEEKRSGSGAELSAKCYELLTLLSADSSRRGDLPVLLENILQTMHGDFRHQLSMNDIAGRCGCGIHTLMRLFRKHLAMTPSEYRERRRFEQARQMLLNTGLSLKEIAERLGYCSQLYFSTAFRRSAGMPPSEYRRTCRSSVRNQE